MPTKKRTELPRFELSIIIIIIAVIGSLVQLSYKATNSVQIYSNSSLCSDELLRLLIMCVVKASQTWWPKKQETGFKFHINTYHTVSLVAVIYV